MIHQVVAAICAIRKAGKRKDGGSNEEKAKTSGLEAGDSGQPEGARV